MYRHNTCVLHTLLLQFKRKCHTFFHVKLIIKDILCGRLSFQLQQTESIMYYFWEVFFEARQIICGYTGMQNHSINCWFHILFIFLVSLPNIRTFFVVLILILAAEYINGTDCPNPSKWNSVV